MLAVLRRPAVLPLFTTCCVARLPMGAMGLLLVLLAEERTGSYARGGALAGIYVLASGVTAPVLARLVDRRGHALVLRAGAALTATAMVTLALTPSGTPLAPLLVLAAVAGAAQPPVGACMRALWPQLVGGAEARHKAYALESVALEIVYIAGPVAIVGGIGAISLEAAILACGLLVLGGDLLFSLHPVSRAQRGGAAPAGDLAGALRGPGVRLLVAVFVLCGLTVGAIEVVVPASTGGDEDLSGLLLGLWGLGSLVGGLAVARAGAARDGVRRLGVLVGAWGLAHALVGLAQSPVALGITLLMAGATIAPTFVTANGMLDGLAPAGALTESFTWMTTGMTAGIAAGAALAGVVVDTASPGLAIGALGGFALLGAVLVLRGGGRALAPRYA